MLAGDEGKVTLPVAFISEKKERLVLNDGPTDRASKLGKANRRLPGCRSGQGITSMQDGILPILIQRAANFARSSLVDHIAIATKTSANLSGNHALLNFYFPDRFLTQHVADLCTLQRRER